MAKKKKLPLVAIIGRPNVGKSTLFNRIIGKSRAIVHDEEGITRDRFFGEGRYGGKRFRVVDTGGIIENPIDPISQKMQAQVDAALAEARVIIFVVDGQGGLTRTDELVRASLFKRGKPVVLAVNKLDNDKLVEQRYDFFSLGMGEPYAISSGHGRGMDALLEAVTAQLPETPMATAAPDAEPAEDSEDDDAVEYASDEEETGEVEVIEVDDDDALADETTPPEETGPIRVAIIGKPNVGKSSFVNAILNEERSIVDSTPGTTRDAIDIEFVWQGQEYVLIDTAGLRRKAGIKAKVEQYSVARSLRAIRRADVCLVMVEAPEGLSEQDKRIIGYCRDQGAAMILVWTKWDLVENKEQRFRDLAYDIDDKMPFIKHVPTITISTMSRQRLFKVFELIQVVAKSARKRISTGALNRFLDEVRREHGPASRRGRLAKIRYMTQVSVKPSKYVLFVNSKELFHFSYLRFLENRLREAYALNGVPLHFELRESKKRHE